MYVFGFKKVKQSNNDKNVFRKAKFDADNHIYINTFLKRL